MHVLQIITKGEAGGAQTHLLELCRALHGQVHFSVLIGGPPEDSALVQRLLALGIQSHFLPAMLNSLSPWRALRAVRSVIGILRQQRPDLIHAHSGMAGAIARVAGRLTGIPVVYTVHGFGFKPEAPWAQRRISLWVEWLLAPWTAHMICVSSHERALAQRLPLPESKTCVVHNAVADDPRRADPAAQPMRVVMVARCAPPKRQDLLLQALALASTQLGHPVTATLVGGGPRLETLQQQAHTLGLEEVAFTGDVDDVPDLLSRHGLFVLLSDHEGQPISVIEALRSGLPILGSDLPGMQELADQNREAWLLPNDAVQIAQALVRLARQPDERIRMGRAARQRYERQCAPGPMAREVLAIYAQIIHHEPRAQP